MSDIDLWNIDLLDTRLDLLDADIPSKYFVSLHSVFKISSRYVFKTSWRHVFKTFSRHVFTTSSRHVFKTSSRRLQRNSFASSKTYFQDIFARRLGRRKIVTLRTFSRRLQDMSSRRLHDQQMFAGMGRRYISWLQYIVSILRIEHWVVFQNGVFW